MATGLVRGRFAVLLAALVSLLVTTPIVEGLEGIEWFVLDAIFTAIILALLYAMSREPHFIVLAVFLALPAVGTRWGVRASDETWFVVASYAVQIGFLVVSMSVVLIEVLRSERVTTDTIFGGISVYLLIVINFALLYGLIEYLAPGSFSLETLSAARLPGRNGFADLMYFSLETMTTLGYGDIVPLAHVARSTAGLEAVTGQVYLAVFVARLVGLHLVHNHPGRFDT